MIHCFKICGDKLLYDIESQSLMEIDDVVFDILTDSQTLLNQYTKEQISEAQAEISELQRQGFLNCQQKQVDVKKNREVKSLCLHISHDCNLRCRYCFAETGSYHGKRENMSIEVAKAAIDFLIENSGNRKNLEVDFFGGEPLLNFDVLKQTVEYAKEKAKPLNKNFKFTTTTNGVLLNKDAAEYLNAEMDNVVLSLDGKKDLNDFHRPTANSKGSFDVVIENFKYFRKIRGNRDYFLRGTYTNKNPNFVDDVLFLADLGFDQISVEPAVLENSHSLCLSEADLLVALDAYEALAKEYLKRRKDPKKWFSFFHFTVDLENGPCEKKRLMGCGAGCEYLAVVPNGDIFPCHQFAGEDKFLLGNVFQKKLDESCRKMFFDSTLNSKTECKNCWAKYHCSGGCAANAVHFSGDINVPHKHSCELTKKRLECALYIFAKEFVAKN